MELMVKGCSVSIGPLPAHQLSTHLLFKSKLSKELKFFSILSKLKVTGKVLNHGEESEASI